jgi:hypothetical protein
LHAATQPDRVCQKWNTAVTPGSERDRLPSRSLRGSRVAPNTEAPERSAPRRAEKMFLVLSGFFVAHAIIAEFISVKIFALEDTIWLRATGSTLARHSSTASSCCTSRS